MGMSLPGSIIEKCAQVIEKNIIPALDDESVAVQAQYTAAMLHLLAPGIEERSKEMIEENDAMRKVLARAKRTIGRKGSKQGCTRLLETLNTELRKRRCSDVPVENQRLKKVLIYTIKGLDGLGDEVSQKTLSLLREHIRTVLRQQINHGMSCLPALEIKT
jgi:hypothetical protein